MRFLSNTVFISVWHCRGNTSKLGHADSKLLLRTTAPRVVISTGAEQYEKEMHK